MKKTKKVLVIDDSAFMRRVISDIINSEPRLEVVDVAKNGKEALQKIKELKPDVVTLDIEMPVMNGLEVLKMIMNENPIPVVMVSSLTGQGTKETILALELGAVDFIAKPTSIFDINQGEVKKTIINKILTASFSSYRQVYKPLYKESSSLPKVMNANKKHKGKEMKKIIAIGTSTGGPRALQEVIPYLPADISAGIIIVQHMPPGFTKSLAERLNNLSKITVKEAEDGDIIEAGMAFIAPGDKHLLVEKINNTFSIRLANTPPVGGHRPAVNVMMDSLSDTNYTNIIGVIMTGMGTDGCQGLVKLKQKNHAHVIAQNEESCVVYGMPKAVVQAGIADRIVPLNQIAHEIINMVGVY